MSQDVDVAVIRAYFVPGVFLSVPLVEEFLDHVPMLIHPKAIIRRIVTSASFLMPLVSPSTTREENFIRRGTVLRVLDLIELTRAP